VIDRCYPSASDDALNPGIGEDFGFIPDGGGRLEPDSPFRPRVKPVQVVGHQGVLIPVAKGSGISFEAGALKRPLPGT